MTKAGTVIVALVIGLASQGLSMPPTVVVDDLSYLQIQRVFPTIQSMPQLLQRPLASTFQQPALSMANPTENLRNEITPGMEPEHYDPHRTKNGDWIIVGPIIRPRRIGVYSLVLRRVDSSTFIINRRTRGAQLA